MSIINDHQPEEFSYNGCEELVILEKCTNYNSSIMNRVIKYSQNKNEKILDFGAGIGTLANILKNNGYTSVSCLEIDTKQAFILKKRNHVVFSTMDSITAGTIDIIYSSNVLEHIENDVAILSDIYSKLKLGGILYLYLPAFECLFTDLDRKVGHFRRYNYNDLSDKLNNIGYKIQEWGYVDSLGFFATLALKFLNNGKDLITEKKVIFYDRYIFPLSNLLDKMTKKIFGKNIYIIAKRL